jgi:branched-chain amino acid transport system ATP-binding protein
VIALSVEQVSCEYGGVKALSAVSFSVATGARHVILGPNGAGKTTLFNVITGEKSLSAGRVLLFGRDASDLTSDRRAWLGLSRTFQITNVFWDLTVEDNVLLASLAQDRSRHVFYRPAPSLAHLVAKTRAMLEDFGLGSLAQARARSISYGEQRQLEIVIALATRARLLLLDEPTAGLSREAGKHLIRLIKNLPTTMTVLLVEHDLDVAFQLSQTATVLHQGELIAHGSVEAVRCNPEVRQVYLGRR